MTKVKRSRVRGARRRRRVSHLVARTAVRVVLVAAVLSFGAVAWVRSFDPPTSAFMVGRWLAAQRLGRPNFEVRHHWVPLSQLPSHVPLAVLAAEDQRFFRHAGFDVREIRSALAEHLDGGRLRGASTLTQQVAKNLFLWEGRSPLRKALEAYLTVLIELVWPKRRILEVYLNVAELGDGVFGVGAAARHHFGREAQTLTAPQAALLAAILPAPTVRIASPPSARVRRKQRWILKQIPIMRALQPATLTKRPFAAR
ncbi:MAG: monofunctional biosynthetic peptidoglycan transglycosylase [Myxococcales bacterium]|nr:monofunctional biosynthetic peptidoglycan transglycosylase [Myxococcales bacterium]MDD9967052.1 monofunctional biosynthetic peptidoglycan transglycosylase [Myxococcales bacterium]